MVWRGLKRLFYYETPHEGEGANDPLYYTHARRVKRTETVAAMRRFNRQVMRGMLAAALVLVILFLVIYGFNLSIDMLSLALFWLTVLAFGAGWVVDFLCLLYGVNSVRQLHDGDMLDFIRVTTVSPTALMQARVRLARLYAWCGFFFVVGLRMLVGGLWMLVWVISMVDMLIETGVAQQSGQLGALIGVPLAGVVLLLREPYWRYRAFTELGVRQAARFDSIYTIWWRVGVTWLGTWAALFSIYMLFLIGMPLLLVIISGMTMVVYQEMEMAFGNAIVSVFAFLFGLAVGASPLLFLRLIWLTLRTRATDRTLTQSGMALLGWTSTS